MATTEECYVYFIKSECYVKIGISKNPFSRAEQLQIGNPITLKILLIVRSLDRTHALEYEQKLHKRMKKHHIRDEWFLLSKEILDFINLINAVQREEEECDGLV